MLNIFKSSKSKTSKSFILSFLSSLFLIKKIVKNNGKVLFTGFSNKYKNFNSEIQSLASSSGHFYINEKGLGSLITNFSEIKKGIDNTSNINYTFSKKKKLLKNLKVYSGVLNLTKRPNLIIVFDIKLHNLLVSSAVELGIPVIVFSSKPVLQNVLTYVVPLSLNNNKILNKVCFIIKNFLN
jgi:small subunit ribosomal protein S2